MKRRNLFRKSFGYLTAHKLFIFLKFEVPFWAKSLITKDNRNKNSINGLWTDIKANFKEDVIRS